MERSVLESLERVYILISRSFLSYLVEAASLFTQDDWDRQVQTALTAWHRDLRSSLRVLEGLLAGEKSHPSLPLWSLSFSQYNMVRPTYLLPQLIPRMEQHLKLVRVELQGLSAWPDARSELEGLVEREEAHLVAVKTLEGKIPREEPKPAAKKGVSANFW